MTKQILLKRTTNILILETGLKKTYGECGGRKLYKWGKYYKNKYMPLNYQLPEILQNLTENIAKYHSKQVLTLQYSDYFHILSIYCHFKKASSEPSRWIAKPLGKNLPSWDKPGCMSAPTPELPGFTLALCILQGRARVSVRCLSVSLWYDFLKFIFIQPRGRIS